MIFLTDYSPASGGFIIVAFTYQGANMTFPQLVLLSGLASPTVLLLINASLSVQLQLVGPLIHPEFAGCQQKLFKILSIIL